MGGKIVETKIEDEILNEVEVEPGEVEVEPGEVEVEELRPGKKTAQERINEITYKFREAERQADYWKDLAMEEKEGKSVTKVNTPPVPVVKTEEARPVGGDFDNIEAYEDALFEWHDKKQSSNAEQTARANHLKENISMFNKNAAKVKQEHEDFDKVVNVPIFTDTMRGVLFGMEAGPMVAYHIAKNKEIGNRIATLSPEKQAYEIGKLESKLVAAQKGKKKSDTPKPLSPLAGVSEGEKDPNKMNTKEYMAWENKRRLEKLKLKLKG